MPSLRSRRRKKRGTGGAREKSAKRAVKREGGTCYESWCFCIPPTIFSTYPIMSTVNTWPITSSGASQHGPIELNYFVYRKLSSRDAFFKWYRNRAKQNVFTVLAPAANTTNIDYEQSLFSYCSQSKANNDQFRVNEQNPCSYLIKQNGHKEQTSRQLETRIMKGEL